MKKKSEEMKRKWDEYEMENGDEKGPNLGRSDGWTGHFEEVHLAKCQLCAIVVSYKGREGPLYKGRFNEQNAVILHISHTLSCYEVKGHSRRE